MNPPKPKPGKAAEKALRELLKSASAQTVIRPDLDMIAQARQESVERIIKAGNTIGDLADEVLIKILSLKLLADGPLVSALRLAMQRSGRLMPDPDAGKETESVRVLVVRAPGAAGTIIKDIKQENDDEALPHHQE